MENKRLPDEIEPVLEYAIKRGDLLVSRANTRELVGCAAVALQDYPWLFICDKIYRLTLKTEEAIPSHVAAYLSSRQARGQIELGATGASQSMQNISQDVIRNLSIPLPCVKEQQAIANFLDRETAKIDALIAEQQRLIELLQEKRQAVISHAVTKGLNPNVPMKDSGVEWLGEVPEHWEVLQLKRLNKEGTSITYGIVQAGPHIEGGVPYIRTSDMAGDSLHLDTCQCTSQEIDDAYARSRVYEGDLVIAIRATVGKTLEVPSELSGANLTQGTAKFSPGSRASAQYVKSAFSSHYCQSQIGACSKGATFLEITLDSLRRLTFAVPPLHEQKEIMVYLNAECKALDDLTLNSRMACALLQERRSALISAAVTGQIDVRGLVEEEPAEQ